MRAIVFVLVSLLIISGVTAAQELYEKTYTDGQTFDFLGEQFLVELVVDDHTHIRGQQYGRILAINHCFDLREGYFCVDDSSNGTTDLVFWQRVFNVSIERTFLPIINVSDEQSMQLLITNNYDRSRYIVVDEVTNLTITNDANFRSLHWEGRLSPGTQKWLRYKYKAVSAGEYFANATAITEGVESVQDEEIEATDFVTYATTYEENPVREIEYNFSLTYTFSGTGNSTINVTLPDGMRITDKGNYTRLGPRKVQLETTDTSETLWFTYIVEDRINGHIEVWHEIDRLGLTTQRLHKEKIVGSGFERIYLVHEKNNKIRVNDTITIPVQVFNPNDKAISASIEITSILYNDSWNPRIPAKNASLKEITVRPNRAGEYAFVFTMEYDDENGDDVEQTGAVLLKVVKDVFEPIPVETNSSRLPSATEKEFTQLQYPQQAVLIAQPTVHENEEHFLRIELVGLNGKQANITLMHDTIEIFSEQRTITELTETIRVNTVGKGMFVATITTDDNTLIASTNVSHKDKKQISTLPEPEPSSSVPWGWIALATIIILAGAFLLVRKR